MIGLASTRISIFNYTELGMDNATNHDLFEAGESRDLQMRVRNLGFLIDKLGADCGPLQFVRELTKNAIQAVESSPTGKGEIIWDYSHLHYKEQGVLKQAIIDTGVGMTGPEMVEYINQLSSSGHVQSHTENFGVGAKISAATRNHAGVVYLSWKAGKGAMIWLWRNPKTGEYGLKQHQIAPGVYQHWVPVRDEIKPPAIRNHGTMVVLFGNDEEANTMDPPPGASIPSKWVAKYLGSRFFRFPAGVTVKAREGWLSDTKANILRTVVPARDFLEREKVTSGQVDVGDATAHWWILPRDERLQQLATTNMIGGHMAALYQDELYEMVSGKTGTARLQSFGVALGHQFVVIYVEPHLDQGNTLTANTARTALLLNGESLPWGEWAEAFRQNLPKEIADLMESVISESHGDTYADTIKNRLRAIADILKIRRYRPSAKGTQLIGGERDKTTGAPEIPEPDDDSDAEDLPRQRKNRRKSKIANLYSMFIVDSGGEPGEEVDDKLDIKVEWVDEENSGATDRAAKFLPEQRMLLVNRDFRVYQDMIDHWEKKWSEVPGARQIVVEVVREWFQQSLLEAIYSAEYLRGSREWNETDLAAILSSEALTAAILPRYHINNAISRALGTRFGGRKDKKAAA
jgi:hypothetical protein